MTNNLSYSDKGLALTKQFEGLRLAAYQDSVGLWTIGYGHTGADVHPKLIITEEQATALLLKDVSSAVGSVNRLLKVGVTQSQFDALVDFVFNLGAGKLASSTLLRKVNAGDFQGAAAQLMRWVHAGGVVLPGLVERRKAEAALMVEEEKAAKSKKSVAG